jgi:hypothetical protein
MTIEPEGPRRTDPARLDQYRRWARFLFVLLAIVAGVGLVLLLVGGGIDPRRLAASWPLGAVLGLNVGATVVVLLIMIQGLRDGAPWALHAVAPVCYVLIAFGLIRLLLALTGGGFLVPLETIAALLVLSRPHGPELLPAASDDDRRRVRLATAVMALTYFVPLLIQLAGP